MTKRDVRSAGGIGAVFERHLETFLQALSAVRYRERTQQRKRKRRTIERFLEWTRDTGPAAVSVDEHLVDGYLERVLGRPCKRGSPHRATLHQFLDHLRRAGVIPHRCDRALSPAEVLVDRYVDYLRRDRGLADNSVEVYAPLVRDFVATHGLAIGDIRLDAPLVRRHLLDRARGRSSEYTRLLATSLRSFLRFLFLRAETDVDLSEAVPPVRRWQLAAVPAFLSPEEVRQVLAAIDRTTPSGRRALAMLLLLARLGLRPGEVATLDLDDVDWTAGEIVVRGKGGSFDRVPLPVDVGKALVLYLRHARGRSPSRRVFLRLCAPRVGLTGPCAVCAVAREAVHRAGLHPKGRVGAHLFRHSLATRMIRQGASLAEISQVLRHRCPATTEIYAKIDFDALRGAARRWPVAVGGAR